MRLPGTDHTSRPWRVHQLAPDFRLEDVWALPWTGGPGDFPRLVEMIAGLDPLADPPPPVRLLFAVRQWLGQLLGWDRPAAGVGARVESLRQRLPADLRDGPAGPPSPALPLRSLYLTEDEWAAESANRTVHGVIHVGLVGDGAAGYRAQLAVLVKPNGLLGSAYLAAIRPFRHLVVYPALFRQGASMWEQATLSTGGVR